MQYMASVVGISHIGLAVRAGSSFFLQTACIHQGKESHKHCGSEHEARAVAVALYNLRNPQSPIPMPPPGVRDNATVQHSMAGQQELARHVLDHLACVVILSMYPILLVFEGDWSRLHVPILPWVSSCSAWRGEKCSQADRLQMLADCSALAHDSLILRIPVQGPCMFANVSCPDFNPYSDLNDHSKAASTCIYKQKPKSVVLSPPALSWGGWVGLQASAVACMLSHCCSPNVPVSCG